MAIMYPSTDFLDRSLAVLTERYGQIKSQSEEYDFTFTDYYEREFGKNLRKKLFVFEKQIQKQDLVLIREETGDIERAFSIASKRQINIDPGYISTTELVLATKKGKDFKENLGHGIFAHRVLGFKHGEIISFKHTFADYRLEKNLEFFRKIISGWENNKK
jgi:hypothetical protein